MNTHRDIPATRHLENTWSMLRSLAPRHDLATFATARLVSAHLAYLRHAAAAVKCPSVHGLQYEEGFRSDQFAIPCAVARCPRDEECLYVSDHGRNRIFRLHFSSAEIQVIDLSMTRPAGLFSYPLEKGFGVCDWGGCTLLFLNPAGEIINKIRLDNLGDLRHPLQACMFGKDLLAILTTDQTKYYRAVRIFQAQQPFREVGTIPFEGGLFLPSWIVSANDAPESILVGLLHPPRIFQFRKDGRLEKIYDIHLPGKLHSFVTTAQGLLAMVGPFLAEIERESGKLLGVTDISALCGFQAGAAINLFRADMKKEEKLIATDMANRCLHILSRKRNLS